MNETTNLQLVRPVTITEAAAYLSVNRRTIHRWILDEGFPVHRVTPGPRGTQRFYVEEIDAWLRSRCSDHEQIGTAS